MFQVTDKIENKNTFINSAEKSEKQQYKQAKAEDAEKFNSYFQDKNIREKHSENRQKENLYSSILSKFEQEKAADLNKLFQGSGRDSEQDKEDILEQLKTPSEGNFVDGAGIQLEGHHNSDKQDGNRIHSITSEIEKIIKNQLVFGELSVRVSVKDDIKIDISLVKQRGKTSILISSPHEEVMNMLGHKISMLEDAVHPLMPNQDFNIQLI